MSILKKILGDDSSRALKKYNPIVSKINDLEEGIKSLSDEDLKAKTPYFKERLAKGESLDDILPEAFAVVREASRRTLGMRHFDVQLLGAIAIHKGNISEMKTGEGKTLVSTLPAYLNALSGGSVHLVTVNDYLAQRDAVWMSQIHNFLGLSVGVIIGGASFLYDPEHKELDSERDAEGDYKVLHEFLRPVTRKDAYNADITYGTNSEFGFDYLRDNIEYEPNNLRQRDHSFAIVDEIDSILIDEARTPLIISSPAEESGDFYQIFARIADKLNNEEDFIVEEKTKSVTLTDSGIEKAEKILGIENIYTEKGIKHVHHLETAVRAKALFKRDKEYVVKDNQVVIVDEFTGRLQPTRRWSEGLHQAVEAKEGVSVQRESRTFASITYQNYFKMYTKLSGMTGTADTSAEEFSKVYGLEVIVVPTNNPIQRKDQNDLIFQTEKGKFQAIAKKVKELHKKGQPVLIGTVSIENNELLDQFFNKEGIPHEILNAKNHEREGQIIAKAGEKGAVTIATNMAGRGIDIKLGGVPVRRDKYEEVKALGGLYVLGTERHEARRIDNQLRGRSGRQGDPGETQFFVSLDDSLMRMFPSSNVKKMMSKMGIPEDEAIQARLVSRSLESAQMRIEGHYFDVRKSILEYDSVLNTQRKAVYKKRREVLLGDVSHIKKITEEISADDLDLQKVIEGKVEAIGEEEFYKAVKRLFLQVSDMLWTDHLESMGYIRSSVGLRAYGQRDPLIEYSNEGKRLYNQMNETLQDQIKRSIPNIGAGAFKQEEEKLKQVVKDAKLISGDNNKSDTEKSKTVINSNKIGRNDIVTVIKDGEEKEMKYKKAEELLSQGWTIK